MSGLDAFCAKTAIPKSKRLESELTIWVIECWLGDVGQNRADPRANKETFGKFVAKFLLRRRVLNFLMVKCRGADEAGRKYLDGRVLFFFLRVPRKIGDPS